jgi:hypothetical protein
VHSLDLVARAYVAPQVIQMTPFGWNYPEERAEASALDSLRAFEALTAALLPVGLAVCHAVVPTITFRRRQCEEPSSRVFQFARNRDAH